MSNSSKEPSSSKSSMRSAGGELAALVLRRDALLATTGTRLFATLLEPVQHILHDCPVPALGLAACGRMARFPHP